MRSLTARSTRLKSEEADVALDQAHVTSMLGWRNSKRLRAVDGVSQSGIIDIGNLVRRTERVPTTPLLSDRKTTRCGLRFLPQDLQRLSGNRAAGRFHECR